MTSVGANNLFHHSERRWTIQRIALIVLACAIALIPLRTSFAQDRVIDRESKIKSAYLYQFIRYVRWPNDAFANARAPLVIGVVGDAPEARLLQAIARRRTAGKRKLSYQKVENLNNARSCHILFISRSASIELSTTILRELQHQPTLIVGEAKDFVRSGGVIGFVRSNNRIRLRLSIKHANSRRLKISSQLAKLAEVVN